MISSVEIGDKIRFKPSCYTYDQKGSGQGGQNRVEIGGEVTGTVVYIHKEHHWFRVAYQGPGGSMQYECFQMPVPPDPLYEPPPGRHIFKGGRPSQPPATAVK